MKLRSIYIRYFSLIAFLAIATFTFEGCVKKALDEVAPPNTAPTCDDRILNQGEYRTDCGGPCPRCNTFLDFTVTVDSTWLSDSAKTANRFWNPKYINLNYDFDSLKIIISATDSLVPGDPYFINLIFAIDRDLKKGVHEIESFASYERYSAYQPVGASGMVSFADGIVTITNRDEVNGLISGEFKINSQPQSGTGYIIVFKDGVFTDIPINPPEPK